jgi:DNA processing protein
MNLDRRDLLIGLSLLPFLTPSRTRLLRSSFDNLEDACNAPTRLLQSLLSVTPEQAGAVKNPLKVHRPLIETLRESVVTLDDPEYPRLLLEIFDPPLVLHVRGDRSALAGPCLSIVGSRRASPYGVNAAQLLARQLVTAGIVVVSGLARGIDAAAHEAALEAGGRTIAVLGTGIDRIYPQSNTRLARTILDSGCIVSEFPPGTPPMPENFPIRNRVISGLSLGTIIVEATSRSGSLITARMAAEQGREVFAVPGSIFSAASEGTHRLIQYGAKLVHDCDDVLDELPGELRRKKETSPPEPESPLGDVLRALSRDEGTHVDTLAGRLARKPGLIAESLLQLELDGWVRALPGARYVRIR